MTETVTRYVPPKNPWEAPHLDDAEVIAIRSLVTGTASQFQQQLALKVIVVKLAGTYDMTFRPGGAEGARASDFAAGKAFVGQRIMEATTRPLKPSNPQGAKDAAGPAEQPGAKSLRKNPKPTRERTKPAKSE